MKAIGAVSFAALATIAASAPVQPGGADHMNLYRKRADRDFGMCRLNTGVNLPPYPTKQQYIIDLENPVRPVGATIPQSLHDRRRAALWGNPAGNPSLPTSFFPHWYHFNIYDGVTLDLPKLIQLPSTDPKFVDPSFGNVDHVFEHYTIRQFLGKMMGFGDPMKPATMVADPVQCQYWENVVNVKPAWYGAKSLAAKGLLGTVYQHLQGIDQGAPEKYPAGEFAGLSTILNNFKGRVFEGRMEAHFQANEHGWNKGTTEDDLTKRMGDIEAVSVVFDLMRKKQMYETYKRTCLRLSKVMYGIDDYLLRGNKATMAMPDTPFTKADGTAYGSFGDEFKVWLVDYLEFVGNEAKVFLDNRIKELEADLNSAAVTATNKDAIKTRLADFKAFGRHTTAFLSLPISSMTQFAVDATEKIALFKLADAEADPFAVRPFVN
ncbi:hypothetical protein ABW19_dt0209424 [Dactylella cylindrospora]|nr:hypothetical protein ABW19_dt0209424 [Dactylella cylindrospora]